MNVQTFCLDNSSPSITRPDFIQDPQKSLVIVFGASNLLDSPERIQALSQTFSDIPMIGCSTSGEVFGNEIKDNSLVGGVLQFDWTHNQNGGPYQFPILVNHLMSANKLPTTSWSQT